MKWLLVAAVLLLAAIAIVACGDTEPTATPAPTLPPTSTPTPTATVAPSPTPSPVPTIAPTATPTAPAPPEPEVPWAAERIEWSECGLAVECGFVEAPADYRNPEAGSIKIAVNVRRAASQDERIGYLFVNPGGPGESGVDVVRDFYHEIFAEEVRRRFDIVGFDPRGVGGSEPEFACGAPGELLELLLAGIELPVDTPEEIAAGEAAANLCIQSMGAVGGLLHSEYVARDMDEIRKALGADEISYLGFSYGSDLGVWYATLFPQSVRAMVVDGADNPVDAAETRQERIDESIEEAGPFAVVLEQALEACANPQCVIYNDGDPVGYFIQATEKLHLVNQAADKHFLAAMLITALYSEERWSHLWLGLYTIQNEEGRSFLLDRASVLHGEDLGFPISAEHVRCLDDWVLYPELDRQTRLEESEIIDAVIDERFPLLALIYPSAPSPCPFYDQFAPDPFELPLDGGDVPILVIGNHYDPATSFGESEELVTETLSNGYLVEVTHPTHTVYPNNTCVNSHVHKALIDREYPSERRVFCQRED